LFSNIINRWRDERLGLNMIFASMLVIGVIAFLLLSYQKQERVRQLRVQATSAAQVLSGVPFAQLRSRENNYGPLSVLRSSQGSDNFAYGIVTAEDGEILNAAVAPGVKLPSEQIPVEASIWPGERTFVIRESGEEILELYAPIIDKGVLAGNVRVGYRMPGYGVTWTQLPFLATLALPIFMLTPLFYFLVRRETRPIHAANQQISDLISGGHLRPFNIEANGELRSFIGRFNEFVRKAQVHIFKLETDNKKLLTSQKLLSYRHMRTEMVLQAIPEAVIVLDENGNISFANDRVEPLFGVKVTDIIGQPPETWCLSPEVLAFIANYTSEKVSQVFDDTLRFVSPLSKQKKLSIRAYPLFSPHDPAEIFGRLLVLRDMTKDALAEESRANFVAHVAHELKSPLNTLSLYAQALQGEQGEDRAFRIEAHNAFHDEVERLAALVNNLLSITKIEMGSLKIAKQRVRLRDLLQDTFNRVYSAGRVSDLEFQIDVPTEIGALSVDKDLFQIAVYNLLVNAVKYSEPGGKITLAAIETDDSVRISVRDTGIGIGAEDQAKIFEKFYRSDDARAQSRSGHGLGLSLAKEIVELHRGQLTVISEPKKGSEFTIDLWKDSGLLQKAI
jgi:signal transduction histidine kinase